MTSPLWPGSARPLGAHFDGSGVNVSIFSEVAERVDLCLFDEQGRETALTLVDARERWHHQDSPPKHPLHRSVIYELHVKGFTS